MKQLSFLTVLVVAFVCCVAQQHDLIRNDSMPQSSAMCLYKKLGSRTGKQADAISENIEKKTHKMLLRLQKQECRLLKKLAKKDSAAALELTNLLTQGSTTEELYSKLTSQINETAPTGLLQEYIPRLDSLKTSVKFLLHADGLRDKLPTGLADKIKASTASLEALETKLQQANEIKSSIQQRKQMLNERLLKYGLIKELKRYNKEVYYYRQQLNEYKALLKEPGKLETRAMAELQKLPAFKAFLQKHSQLAQLFKLPENYGSPESLAGLQTRASVENQLQQRYGVGLTITHSVSGGSSPTNYVQQQIGEAQAELSKLKDKLRNSLEGDAENAPDFRPNTQKTKTFWKRIEYGANIQSQKTNAWLPVSSDLALTAGFKINDRSIIGVGGAYKLGWGSDWKHIKFTSEGIGLRSYIDYKLSPIFGKIDGFWLTGGYEKNYQHSFEKFDELKNVSAWQTSGLLGLTKKYKIGKKTNTLQLLWDFLSYNQVPRRQAVVFRVGWVF